MRNVKKIKIIIPSEAVLKKINTTPALKQLVRTKLSVGENKENVNHQQFASIKRMFTIAGCKVEEI